MPPRPPKRPLRLVRCANVSFHAVIVRTARCRFSQLSRRASAHVPKGPLPTSGYLPMAKARREFYDCPMGLLSRLAGRKSLSESVIGQAFVVKDAGRSDVAGESHYQDCLRATAQIATREENPRRGKGWPTFDAFLVLEPTNQHDPHAVAVYSTRGAIGHAPRGSDWFALLTELKRRGKPAARCRAHLISGSEGIYGAVLHADAAKELSALDAR